MIKLISHRGNIVGQNKVKENTPDFIDEAIDKGFDVEIDVWVNDKQFYLGHDFAEHKIEESFLTSRNKFLWCHAKNLEGLETLLSLKDMNYFWHQEDDYTLTSKSYIWTYPNKPVRSNNIIVCKTLEETLYYSKQNIYGICSDYVEHIK